MNNKRKLDQLINSFDNLTCYNIKDNSIVVAPNAKRVHYFSKVNYKYCPHFVKSSNYKQKNIFGLDSIPDQETFSHEEVQILLDQRERILYRTYLQTIARQDPPQGLIENTPVIF